MVSKTNSAIKKYPTIGVCGLDCGLCPRYHTVGPSKCPGCGGSDFFSKHPSCSFITCCVKSKGYEVCAQCPDFPCSKFKNEEEYQQVKESSSYPSYKKVIPNLKYIKKYGIEKFIEQQKKRLTLFDTMMKNFDDGRSKSFFCKTAILFDTASLTSALDKAIQKIKTDKIKQDDMKSKAKILREILTGIALKDDVELVGKK